MEDIFRKVEHVYKDHILKDVLGKVDEDEGRAEAQCKFEPETTPVDTSHRFQSFSSQTSGNAKWYVDGASYFWAVSMALEGNLNAILASRMTTLADEE
jgi:phospholipase D1/2